MTKEEDSGQKEVETSALNLELILSLIRDGFMNLQNKLRYVCRPFGPVKPRFSENSSKTIC